MTQQANAHSCDFTFAIDIDLIGVHLQPYHQNSLYRQHQHKLSKMFYGLFCITEHIGHVTY